jgi:MoaA/NifB/PqqE/SkfB family radical SAM enzyme
MKPVDSSVFCSVPYSSIVISPDGSYRVCSLMNREEYSMGACLDDKGEVMNVLTHSFEQALNSKWHKHLRRQQSRSIKSPMCECCYNKDAIDGNSRRVQLTKYMAKESPGFVDPVTGPLATDSDGTYYGHLTSLDLRFGNLCNLACLTCGPWYSDKWYEDYEALTGRSKFTWGGRTIDISDSRRLGPVNSDTPWWETEIWWSRFDKSMPHLRHVYVTAGEPLLVKGFQEMLQRLVDSGFAKNVVVELDTNLTVLNPKIMNLWSEFKRINLRVSVDELGEKYEVFRYPGKFSTLDSNLRTLIASQPGNVDLLLTSCLTPLNVFSIGDLEAYNRALGITRGAHFRFVDSPSRLDLRNLAPHRKDYIIQYLEKSEASVWAAKVILYLREHYSTVSPKDERDFVSFMDLMDARRGHRWRKTFPLTSHLLNLER